MKIVKLLLTIKLVKVLADLTRSVAELIRAINY